MEKFIAFIVAALKVLLEVFGVIGEIYVTFAKHLVVNPATVAVAKAVLVVGTCLARVLWIACTRLLRLGVSSARWLVTALVLGLAVVLVLTAEISTVLLTPVLRGLGTLIAPLVLGLVVVLSLYGEIVMMAIRGAAALLVALTLTLVSLALRLGAVVQRGWDRGASAGIRALGVLALVAARLAYPEGGRIYGFHVGAARPAFATPLYPESFRHALLRHRGPGTKRRRATRARGHPPPIPRQMGPPRARAP